MLRRLLQSVVVSVTACFAILLSQTATAQDAGASTKQAEVVVRPIEGVPVAGTLSSLNEDSVAIRNNDGAVQTWPLVDVLSLSLSLGQHETVPPQAETPPLVLLTNNDCLPGMVTSVDEELLTLDWTATSPPTSLTIPLEAVRSIVFRQPEEMLDQIRIQRLWALLKTDADRMISTDYTHIDGELAGLSDQKLRLKTALAMVTAPVEQLFAIIMSSELSSTPKLEGAYALATLVNGSRVTWDSVELGPNGDLRGTTVWGTKLTVPVDRLVRLQFLGERVIAIAELEPSMYKFTPYLTGQHPLIANRNVKGGALRLRGTTFATGLGVYSKCEVSYDLTDGEYAHFRAIVGIDDMTGGDGNVVFAVEVDNRRVYESPPLSGKRPAEKVGPINVAGAQKLTLVVDFGQFANIQDVANWCDALLIKVAN